MYPQVRTRIEEFCGRNEQQLWRTFLLFMGAGIAAALFHLFSLLFLQRIEDPVAPIHWMMGRAVLNGLTPYQDIFETKPPGMFVLSALSFALFKGSTLGNTLHTLLLVLLPALFTLAACRWGRRLQPGERALLPACALLGSAALLRYLLPHPGPWSPDFFGAAFGVLFLLAIAEPASLTRTRLLLAGAALFASVGIKEPFLLSLLAGALVLLPSWRTLLRGWVIPLIGVAGAGVSTLLLTGWLGGYTSVYLPAMFSGYIHRHILPLYQRGLAVDLVTGHLWDSMPALPLFILSCLFFLTIAKERQRAHLWAAATTFLLVLSLFFLLALTGPRLMFATSRWTLGGILAVGCGILLFRSRERRERFFLFALLLAATALLLTSFHWCTRASPLFRLSIALLSAFPGANLPCMGMLVIVGALSLLPLLLLFLPRPRLRRETFACALASAFLPPVIFFTYLSILIRFFLETPVHPLIPLPPLLLVAGTGAHLASQWGSGERRAGGRVLILCAALFLAIAAISLGTDFQNQHFLAATPFYAALLLAMLRTLPELPAGVPRRMSLAAFTTLAALTHLSPSASPILSLRYVKEHIRESQQTMALAQESAKRIDTILDRCNVERYYITKGGESDFNPFHGFTRHSPLNFFYWAGLETIDQYAEPLVQRETRNLFHAQIIVAGDQTPIPTRPWEKDIQDFLQQEFMETPWPCAKGLVPPAKRTMLYRKQAPPFSQ